jgi:L-aspartate oxidase
MEMKTDYLIIGSGVAGLSFALQAAKSGTVAIVTKKEKMETSTNYAQGGIASVFDPDDSHELHIQDTLESGGGLCNEEIVRMVFLKKGGKGWTWVWRGAIQKGA